MKTIGLIGGMSWESSLEYYRLINQGVKARLGGFHSAKCLMYSVDFAEIEELQHKGDWETAGTLLADAAHRLELGGADLIVLCTNTMHKVAKQIEQATHLPLLHIADPTAQAVLAQGINKVGLLGTRFTMKDDFYKGRLSKKFGLEVLTPEGSDRMTIHRIIYDELVLGQIRQESKEAFLGIMARMATAGAQGIILGCTEIGLLVKQPDFDLPLFDTTLLHAQAAVEIAVQ